MNWKRIGTYTTLLFLALIASGIPAELQISEGTNNQYMFQGFAISFGIELVFFTLLARKQIIKPYIHVFAVVILLNIFTLPFSYFLKLESPLLLHVIDSILMLLAANLGTFLGIRMQSKQVN